MKTICTGCGAETISEKAAPLIHADDCPQVLHLAPGQTIRVYPWRAGWVVLRQFALAWGGPGLPFTCHPEDSSQTKNLGNNEDLA